MTTQVILAILSITLLSSLSLASASIGNVRRVGSLRRRGVLHLATRTTSQTAAATTINTTRTNNNSSMLRRRQLNQDPIDQDLDDNENFLAATTFGDDYDDLPFDVSLFSGDASLQPAPAESAEFGEHEQEGDGFVPAEYEDDYYKFDDDSFDDDGSEYYAYLEEKLESTKGVSEQAGQI